MTKNLQMMDTENRGSRSQVLLRHFFLVSCTLLPQVVLFIGSSQHSVGEDFIAGVEFDPNPATSLIPLSNEAADNWMKARERFYDLPWYSNYPRRLVFDHSDYYKRIIARCRGGLVSTPIAMRQSLLFEFPDGSVGRLERRGVGIQCESREHQEQLSFLSQSFEFFPEVSGVGIYSIENCDDLEPFLGSLRKLEFLGALTITGERPLTLPEMQAIVGHPSIGSFFLTSDASQPALAELAELKTLTDLRLPSHLGTNIFEVASLLPQVQLLVVTSSRWDDSGIFDESMNVPISDEVARAIESLDGRLKAIVFEQYVPVHPSIVRAFSKVRSLERIEMDEVGYGLRMDDIASFAELDNLTKFSISQHPSQSDLQHPGYEEMMQLKASIRQRAEERRQERVQRTMQEVEQQKSQATESVVEREDD